MVFHFEEMDATKILSCDEEEEYIDLELSSSSPSRILCSSPQTIEFEFQMSSAAAAATSPADELFYKGKLLPLHLPPRRQLLLHPSTTFHFSSSMPSTNAVNTPSDSCNISPSESRRVSCDLNSDDFSFDWSNEVNAFINHEPPTKTSWPKKLKHSIFKQKLRASKAYLKSLFVKSACSQDSSTKKQPTIATIINSIEEINGPRRSFSRAIKRHSPTTSSSSSNSSSGSSSFSLNSNNNLIELHCLRRSSSATEIECSIEGAIAYCKKSQQHL